METFEGRIAVVTGAASGMGLAFARRFASEGMCVVLADIERKALDRAVASILEAGGQAIGVETDVSQPAAVEALAEWGIDIGDARPRSLADAPVEGCDVVITMGCGDACPVHPGVRYLDWDLDDPAGLGVEAVRPIRDEIDRRVRTLVAELTP